MEECHSDGEVGRAELDFQSHFWAVCRRSMDVEVADVDRRTEPGQLTPTGQS